MKTLQEIVQEALFKAFADNEQFSNNLRREIELLGDVSQQEIATFAHYFQEGWKSQALNALATRSQLNPRHPMHSHASQKQLNAFRRGFEAREKWRKSEQQNGQTS